MHPHPASSARLPADRAEPIDPRMPTMRHLPPLSCLLAAALAGAHASAQSLIGGAHSPATGPILARQDLCTASERLCAPLLAPPPAPFAGGTAYDPTRQAVWNTDGVSLVGLSALADSPCREVFCGPMAVPVPVGALACGLAYDETRNALWMIDSSPTLSLLRTSSSSRCPEPASRCSLANVIPATHRPGGLAVSETHQLVFWSASVFGGGAPATVVFVAPAADPCHVVCRITVLGTVGCAGVPLGPVTGMAYDDCTDRLFVTDGTRTLAATFTPPCTASRFACCPAPLVAPWYGLDVESRHPVTVGRSCLQAPCAACPNLALDTVGDPALGNG